MKTSLLLLFLFSWLNTIAQTKPTDCRFSKLAKYQNGDTDTIIIRANFFSIDKMDSYPMLDTISKKGLAKRSDYRSAITLWINNCKKRYVPLYTTGWYPDNRFNTKKYHGKEYNFTCVFYKGYSDQKDDFFVVLSMDEIKK